MKLKRTIPIVQSATVRAQTTQSTTAMSPLLGTFHIKSFGCQMNAYDASRMTASLQEIGLLPREDWQQADVVILNTCSVRDKAQEKLFNILGRLRQLKDERPHLLIGVGGCVASQEAERILDRAPYVDVVFGPQSLHRLPELLARRQKSGAPQLDVSFPELEKFDALPPVTHHGPCAFVTIMEGCSKYCSFCVVPYTRGEEISRPLDQVLEEVAALVAQGAREITFLGQNVNAYQGKMSDGDEADLTLLLTYAAQIPGVLRLRFTTSHPINLTPRLAQAFANEPRISSHLHLPLQSGSDKILTAMKRGYTLAGYKEKIAMLRQHRPDLHLTSDFIVGFPGESDDDFAKTLRAAEEIDFDDSFAFIYSPRPGTPAARLPEQVAREVSEERLARLLKVLGAQSLALRHRQLGKVAQVLVEGPSRRDPREMSGRTSHNHMVTFPAAMGEVGRLLPVRITQAATHTLRGEVVADLIPA